MRGKSFTVKVTRPPDLANQALRLKIRLSPLEAKPDGCRPSLSLAFHVSGAFLWSPPREGLEIEGVIPQELYDETTFSASVLITDVPDGPGLAEPCSYGVAETALEAVGTGDEAESAGPSPSSDRAMPGLRPTIGRGLKGRLS